MTVCLGVLNTTDNSVVVAADHMVTGGPAQVEFEHEGPKIESLSSNCVALSAGSALVGTPLFRDVRSAISDRNPDNIREIVDMVKSVFVKHRLAAAEDLHLRGRGITIQQFYEHKINEWPDGLSQALDSQIQETKLNTQLLIAGVDTEPHICVIEDPGVETSMDSIGFIAIGSGALLATVEWIRRCSGPAQSMAEAIYVAHEAKLRSESHPGVGERTDMMIVFQDRCVSLPDDEIEWLRQVQQEQDTGESPDLNRLQEWIDGINREEGTT